MPSRPCSGCASVASYEGQAAMRTGEARRYGRGAAVPVRAEAGGRGADFRPAPAGARSGRRRWRPASRQRSAGVPRHPGRAGPPGLPGAACAPGARGGGTCPAGLFPECPAHRDSGAGAWSAPVHRADGRCQVPPNDGGIALGQAGVAHCSDDFLRWRDLTMCLAIPVRVAKSWVTRPGARRLWAASQGDRRWPWSTACRWATTSSCTSATP